MKSSLSQCHTMTASVERTLPSFMEIRSKPLGRVAAATIQETV